MQQRQGKNACNTCGCVYNFINLSFSIHQNPDIVWHILLNNEPNMGNL